jgi:3'-phosphoadenosine 5'-phosphosulfate sulfotransferase (PAPS reductase)/FAD synthetase
MAIMSRTVVWFSAGAASAVAAKLAIAQRDNVVVAYCDPGSEHPDSKRFIADVEKWLNSPVLILKSTKYVDTWDVYDKTRYLVGAEGARCTTELKKAMRHGFQEADDLQAFGFTAEEHKRAREFRERNPEVDLWTPLIDAGLTKPDCHAIIERAGIEQHAMYRLGYKNANCIACPKGGMGYWNKIRVDFPVEFARMAAVERRLNIAVNKEDGPKTADGKRGKSIPVFLDELAPGRGDYAAEESIECGVLCATAEATWTDEEEDCEA